MANDLNRWQGIGRLGKEVEIRYLPSGSAVASVSMACSRSWKDKTTGAKKEEAEWVNITAFDKLADIMAKYLTKGSQVFIEGRLKTDKWDKDGQTHYSTKVIADNMQMLGGGQNAQQGASQAPQQQNQQKSSMAATFGTFDDDVVF